MTRNKFPEQLKALEKRHQSLVTEWSRLALHNRELAVRHSILSCWCEAFSMLQVNLSGLQPGYAPEDGSAAQLSTRWEGLLSGELKLLNQLGTRQVGLLTVTVD